MLYPIPPPSGFAFHVVEVMSSPRFHLKRKSDQTSEFQTWLTVLRVGISRCADGFLRRYRRSSSNRQRYQEGELLPPGPWLTGQDLLSPHIPLPPLPLTALPHLLSSSPSLSHTLHADLLHLLTHSSPRIRKRAVLCLLPCWEAFPDGLREGFPRLRDKLQDEDQGVVGATVGVVMELARRQGGRNYLPLAPELFAILTGSSNNWMLIKVVKLVSLFRSEDHARGSR